MMGFLHVARDPLVELGFCGAAHPPAPSSLVFNTAGFDQNSLVNGRMWSPEWLAQQYVGLYSPTITLFDDPTDGPCALVNAAADSPAYGTVYTRFVCPSGCTSVTLRIKIKLPTGAAANSIRFGLFEPNFSGFVGGLVLTPTPSGTLTTYTQVYTGLTPGGVYYAIANFNYPAQGPCLVRSVEVIPANGDGLFGGTFYRLACTDDVALYDGQPSVYYSAGTTENTHRASSNTRYAVLTNATLFAVDMAVSSTTFTDYDGVGVRVNGAPAEFLSPGSTGFSLQTFTVAEGNRRVELYVAPLWKGLIPGDGAWPRALYVGACTSLSLPGELAPTAPKFLIIGDSVTCGFFASPGLDAWSILTDAGRAKAVMRACAGQSLFDTCADAAARTAYVASFAGVDFNHLYLDVGANDAANTTFGDVATFKAAYADLVDKFHTAYPTKGVYLQSPFVWAVAVDSACAPYRTAIQEVATARAWSTFIDGTTLVDVSYLVPADNFHFTTAGHAVIAASIGIALGV